VSEAEVVLRSMAGAGFGVAALWAAWGAGLFLRQRRTVFRPNRGLIADPSDLGLEFEDAFLRLASGERIHGWWIPGDGPGKVILCFVGSFGNMSLEVATAAFLRGLGTSVFMVDYPGFGRSEGRPSEGGCYRTAAAAWEFAVGAKGVRPQEVTVFGRSLGGCVAAWLVAHRPACRRLIVHSAFTSMPDVAARAYPLFPVRYFCYLRFDTLEQVRACRCPILVLHSPADSFIPFRHGERILEEATGPKRLIPLVGSHDGSAWQQTPGLRGALAELIAGGEVGTCA
jgi:hypothetical protein